MKWEHLLSFLLEAEAEEALLVRVGILHSIPA